MQTDHDIIRQEDGTISGLLPVATINRGMAMQTASTDADTGLRTFQLASGRADGFVSRGVRTFPGLTDEEQLMMTAGIIFGLETPFQGGNAGSLEDVDSVLEFEAEDSYIELADTGAKLTSGTTLGTPLTFLVGKVCKAQSGDFAQYKLTAVLTPRTPTKLRIRAVKIAGYIVA